MGCGTQSFKRIGACGFDGRGNNIPILFVIERVEHPQSPIRLAITEVFFFELIGLAREIGVVATEERPRYPPQEHIYQTHHRYTLVHTSMICS